jgi:hypothetical protein
VESETIKAVGHGGGADDHGRGSPNDSAESYDKNGKKGAADDKPPASRLAFGAGGDGPAGKSHIGLLKRKSTFRQTLNSTSGKQIIGTAVACPTARVDSAKYYLTFCAESRAATAAAQVAYYCPNFGRCVEEERGEGREAEDHPESVYRFCE